MNLEANKVITSSRSSLSLFIGKRSEIDFAKNYPVNVHFGIIDGKESKTKEKLLDTIAKELQFPSYFGKNWDALDECINDLSWIKSNKIVLIFTNFEYILSEENEGEIKTLLEILKESVVNWNKQIYFSIIIQVESKPTSEIKEILGAALNGTGGGPKE